MDDFSSIVAPTIQKQKHGKATKVLKKYIPVLAKQADPAFKKRARGFAYGINGILALMGIVTLIEVLVADPKIRSQIHGVRALLYGVVAALAAYSVYRGHDGVEINIGFYVVKLLVILAINLAIASAEYAKFKEAKTMASEQGGENPGFMDYVQVGTPFAMSAFTVWLIGQQFYRMSLGKTKTPVNMFFAMLSAIFMMFSAGSTAFKHWENMK